MSPFNCDLKDLFQEENIVFEVGLEIREDDGKGGYVYVPRWVDKSQYHITVSVRGRSISPVCTANANNLPVFNFQSTKVGKVGTFAGI